VDAGRGLEARRRTDQRSRCSRSTLSRAPLRPGAGRCCQSVCGSWVADVSTWLVNSGWSM
jgi:hypothetical protein